MRNFIVRFLYAPAALLIFSTVSIAQTAQSSGAPKPKAKPGTFDARDFSGVWNPAQRMQPRGQVNPIDLSGHPDPLPPFNPAGQAKYLANKKFIDAGNKQWGDKMQDDITWGVKYLVAQGIADPKHVGIMGGSYGGYATLAGVTFTPDLYTAAVDYVGPSNLNTLLETIPPYWEAGRQLFYQRMGDPTTPEGKAQLDRMSKHEISSDSLEIVVSAAT